MSAIESSKSTCRQGESLLCKLAKPQELAKVVVLENGYAEARIWMMKFMRSALSTLKNNNFCGSGIIKPYFSVFFA
jgi:hypothetical protein